MCMIVMESEGTYLHVVFKKCASYVEVPFFIEKTTGKPLEMPEIIHLTMKCAHYTLNKEENMFY